MVSLLTGQLLASANHDKIVDANTFVATLAFVSGIIESILGLFRLGIIVDFIPVPVIAGFTTGAAIT